MNIKVLHLQNMNYRLEDIETEPIPRGFFRKGIEPIDDGAEDRLELIMDARKQNV